MITNALTRMFDIEHPIVLAPMGGVSGGRLAGEGIDLVDTVESAGKLVKSINEEAEQCLARAVELCRHPR